MAAAERGAAASPCELRAPKGTRSEGQQNGSTPGGFSALLASCLKASATRQQLVAEDRDEGRRC
jgi:hypothetical protein